MTLDHPFGIGTALLLVVGAALLLRGRFTRRDRKPGSGDPATWFLHSDAGARSSSDRDSPTRADADDTGSDGDGGGD